MCSGRRSICILEYKYLTDTLYHIVFHISLYSRYIEPPDIIYLRLLSRKRCIFRDSAEIDDIEVLVGFPSLRIHRYIVYTDHEYIFDNVWISRNTWLFMELTKSYTPHIRLTITVSTELLPALELLMKHEEDFRLFWICDHHRPRQVSVEVLLHEGKFSMFLYPSSSRITRNFLIGKAGCMTLKRSDKWIHRFRFLCGNTEKGIVSGIGEDFYGEMSEQIW